MNKKNSDMNDKDEPVVQLSYPLSSDTYEADYLALVKHDGLLLGQDSRGWLLVLIFDGEIPEEEGDESGWVLWWLCPRQKDGMGGPTFEWKGSHYWWSDIGDYTLSHDRIEQLWQQGKQLLKDSPDTPA